MDSLNNDLSRYILERKQQLEERLFSQNPLITDVAAADLKSRLDELIRLEQHIYVPLTLREQ